MPSRFRASRSPIDYRIVKDDRLRYVKAVKLVLSPRLGLQPWYSLGLPFLASLNPFLPFLPARQLLATYACIIVWRPGIV